jgi:hypothetical protein
MGQVAASFEQAVGRIIEALSRGGADIEHATAGLSATAKKSPCWRAMPLRRPIAHRPMCNRLLRLASAVILR